MDYKKKFFYTILPAAGMLIFLFFIFGINLFHFNYEMNSDIASEALLGYVSYVSREWIPHAWYPSSETRIISTPNIAAVLNGMIKDMVLAMGIACCIMTVAILGSMYFFLKRLDMQKYWWWMGFTILILPQKFDALELLYLFACYYAINVVALFITLGIFGGMLKSGKCRLWEMLISVLLAICLGAQGARGLLVIYGPLFGVEVIRNLYLFYSNRRPDKGSWTVSGWVGGLLIASFVGMSFPFSTGQKLSRNIRKGLSKLLEVVFPDMGATIGILECNSWIGRVCFILLLVVAVYILLKIIVCMAKKQEIGAPQWAYLVLFASPVVTALLIAFTTTESSERYYFVFLFVMAFALFLSWEQCGMKRQILLGTIPIVLSVISWLKVYRPVFACAEPPETDAYAVVECLEENGIEIAYANFDNANYMTVLSRGKVAVRPVASMDKMDICKWLSSTEWYPPNVPYKQTTAYIIGDNDMEAFEIFKEDKADELRELQQIGWYHIFISEYNYSTLEEG